jgi:hypothetical protein
MSDDYFERQRQIREEARREEARRDEERWRRQKEEARANKLREGRRTGDYSSYLRDVAVDTGFPYAGTSSHGHTSSADYTAPPRLNPEAEAARLEAEMYACLTTLRSDPSLSARDKEFLSRMFEANYLDKIRPCLTAHLEQIEQEKQEIGFSRSYDPLGYLREIHSQQLQELEHKRYRITLELQRLEERTQVLVSEARWLNEQAIQETRRLFKADE